MTHLSSPVPKACPKYDRHDRRGTYDGSLDLHDTCRPLLTVLDGHKQQRYKTIRYDVQPVTFAAVSTRYIGQVYQR